MGKVYEGQVGVKIELETYSDLSGATLTEIKYKKPGPGGTKGTWAAVVDGTKMYYVTTAAVDLDKRGTLQLQAHASGAGFDLLGETAEMTIHPPWG